MPPTTDKSPLSSPRFRLFLFHIRFVLLFSGLVLATDFILHAGKWKLWLEGSWITAAVVHLIAHLFREDKFLIRFEIFSDRIELDYLTPFGRLEELMIRNTTVTKMKLKKTKPVFFDTYGYLRIYSKDNDIVFTFLNRESRQEAERFGELFEMGLIKKTVEIF